MEEVEKEVKKLLDKFDKALDKIDFKGDIYLDRGDFEREENGECVIGFKEKILENAPRKDGDFILVEKKKW